MSIIRFLGPYHQSNLKAVKRCGWNAMFEIVYGYSPSFRHFNAVWGTAIHAAVDVWHRSGKPELSIDDAQICVEWEFLAEERNPQYKDKRHIPIWFPTDNRKMDIEAAVIEFGGMFHNYTVHPFNTANDYDVLASEVEFEFESKRPGCKPYRFAGRIDQVRAYGDFIAQVDLKSGMGDKMISQFTLDNDIQHLTYDVAIHKGAVKGLEYLKGVIPRTVQFNLRDLIPYSFTPTGKTRKWKVDVNSNATDDYKAWVFETAIEVSHNDDGYLIGAEFQSGQLKGPGAHWSYPCLDRLVAFEKRLRVDVQPYRTGRYSPTHSIQNCNKCAFKSVCEAKSLGREPVKPDTDAAEAVFAALEEAGVEL